MWLDLAETLLFYGRITAARKLSEEALLHSKAQRNARDISRCLFVLAKIAQRDGKLKQAEQIIKECLNVDVGRDGDSIPGLHNVEFYCNVQILRLQVLLSQGTLERAFQQFETVNASLVDQKKRVPEPIKDLADATIARALGFVHIEFANACFVHFRDNSIAAPPETHYLSLIANILAKAKVLLQPHKHLYLDALEAELE
eukprot:gene21149-7962_t